ncbi:MAG: competence/damage-inducible protein A [Chloroflexi bacterium]|nr:competence/damage-inducible protein A [Chloroflexota bacterium]
MKAEIISIGTELLLGEIVNTNASYLAASLPALGIDLYWITVVGDNLPRMKEAIERAWGRSEMIITSGGLGPTEDDLTREAIAGFLGEEMAVDEAQVKVLEERFRKRQMPMPARNLKQAMVIPSGCAIPNPRGTAPGWWVERDGRIIVALPGPPGELRPMWERQIVPRVEGRSGGMVLVTRTLKTFGAGEALVDEMVSPLFASANPTLGIYAKPDGVHLRLAAKARSRLQAETLIAPAEARLRSILGDLVWGVDDDTPEAMVGKMLKERGLWVAVMESFTGGLLASAITDVPGSSDYFRGGWVSYTAETKIEAGIDPQLIARHGVVSAEVAEAMASTVRTRLKAHIGISTTGVAGPSELEGHPPGSAFVALDDGQQTRSFKVIFPGDRLMVKRRAVVKALLELRSMLVEKG